MSWGFPSSSSNSWGQRLAAVLSLTPDAPCRRCRLTLQLLQRPLSLPAVAADRSAAALRTGVPPYHSLSSCISSVATVPAFNRIALTVWCSPLIAHPPMHIAHPRLLPAWNG